MTPSKAAIEAFFTSRPNFVCPKFNGRILRQYCFQRLIAGKPGKGAYGSKKPDNFMDAYCRSGECPIGRETIKLLKAEKDYLAWKDGRKPPKDADSVQKAHPRHESISKLPK